MKTQYKDYPLSTPIYACNHAPLKLGDLKRAVDLFRLIQREGT